jgi:hypothetical protein|nr:hypothetical protein [Neorhizobium tomejilense]
MSSDSNPEHRVVYASAKRVVVTNGKAVVELAGQGGWVRTVGTAGPMNGEKLATFADGVWTPELPEESRALVEFAQRHSRT